jgi:hypothetical protein
MLRSLQEITCHPCRYIAKNVFSSEIIASSSEALRSKHKEVIQSITDDSLRGAQKLSLSGQDGIKLDAVEIKRTGTTKWLLCVNPTAAIWQSRLPKLLELSEKMNVNVLCVNYRATGKSEKRRPTSFNDLFSDVETGLEKLIKDGISKDNIIMYGQSIGCVTALHLGEKHKLKVVAQNTFSLLSCMFKASAKIFGSRKVNKILISLHLQEGFTTVKDPQGNPQKGESKPARLLHRVKFSLEDAFLSLPHLALRVSYFFLSFLDNIFLQQEWALAGKDLIEIGKTVAIDTTLTITGFLSLLISPCSNKLNQLNAKLKSFYLTRSAIRTYTNSPKFIWLAEKILTSSGWVADNVKLAKAVGHQRLFIVNAHHDKKVPAEDSLGHVMSDHGHVVHRPNKEETPLHPELAVGDHDVVIEDLDADDPEFQAAYNFIHPT